MKGQTMEVETISENPFDLSASKYKKNDYNGEACALVKVVLPLQDVAFEGNVMGDVKYDAGEYWVYLPSGTKTLRIKHPKKRPLPVNFEDYGIKIKGLRTYQLIIKTENEEEKVIFKVTPKHAILTVDQQKYPIDDELAIISLTPGEHTYTVFAQGYKEQSDKFTVSRGQLNKIDIKMSPIVNSNPYSGYNQNNSSTRSSNYNNNGAFRSNSKENRYFANNSLVKKNDFYIEVGLGFEVREDEDVKVIPLTLPIAIGGHIGNFNIEADFSLMNIIDREYDLPYGYSVPQYSVGFKLGYGFTVGNRFKITPQIGYRWIFDDYYSNYASDIETEPYGNITLGMRTLWALSKRVGISVTPEYGFGIDDGYGGFAIKAAFALTF